VVNGDSGIDVLNLTVQSANDPAGNVDVNRIEIINLYDNYGATFGASDIGNQPTINVIQGEDVTTTITQGSLDFIYSLQGDGELHVELLDTENPVDTVQRLSITCWQLLADSILNEE
jgi:hypothetical protein